MSHAKRASKGKRRRIALPVLGATGVSLAVAGGAYATAPTANVSLQETTPRPEIILGEEEIADVSLATFYVFDRNPSDAAEGGQRRGLEVHEGSQRQAYYSKISFRMSTSKCAR